MRNLSSTLTAAQKERSRRPYPMVEVYDKIAAVTRHHWERYYTGSEDDYFHAACMPGDGSLIRLRVDPSTKTLYRQRVTSPGSGSTYSSWTSWEVDAYAVALAAYGANVWAFRIDATDGHLYRCESTDNGASWGSWIDMGNISGDEPFRLGACAKSLTEALILYADGTDLYRRRLSGGSWESAAVWTNNLASITGVACVHMGDWNIILTGTESSTTRPGVWTCLLGDGYSAAPGNWLSLKELIVAESNSDIAYKFPTTAMPDSFRCFFVEDYNGSEAYSRPYWSHTPGSAEWVANLWREPVPFNLSSNYGLALCWKSPGVWLTRPDGVWHADYLSGNCDITDSVLAIHATAKESGGNISIVLRNDDGRFDNIGDSGDNYEHIKLGAELRFSPGYHTTSGSSPEVSSGMGHWIESYEYVSEGADQCVRPQSTLVLYGIDAWGLLERWKARRQFVWDSGDNNIFQLLEFVLARAGLECTSVGGSSSAITDLKPAFTINPGESGKTVVQRLLSMIPDVLWFRCETGYLTHIQVSDSSDYTYGIDHDVLEGKYRTSTTEINRAQVTGDGVFTEDFYWDSIDLIFDSIAHDHDLALDTTTRAHARGDAILRKAEVGSSASGGQILVPMNCGQEIYDVVTITDQRAPLDGIKMRVLGLEHLYNSQKGVFALRIALGGL